MLFTCMKLTISTIFPLRPLQLSIWCVRCMGCTGATVGDVLCRMNLSKLMWGRLMQSWCTVFRLGVICAVWAGVAVVAGGILFLQHDAIEFVLQLLYVRKFLHRLKCHQTSPAGGKWTLHYVNVDGGVVLKFWFCGLQQLATSSCLTFILSLSLTSSIIFSLWNEDQNINRNMRFSNILTKSFICGNKEHATQEVQYSML